MKLLTESKVSMYESEYASWPWLRGITSSRVLTSKSVLVLTCISIKMTPNQGYTEWKSLPQDEIRLIYREYIIPKFSNQWKKENARTQGQTYCTVHHYTNTETLVCEPKLKGWWWMIVTLNGFELKNKNFSPRLISIGSLWVLSITYILWTTRYT